MKRVMASLFCVCLILSLSFVSAGFFSDTWNKLFNWGDDEVLMEPGDNLVFGDLTITVSNDNLGDCSATTSIDSDDSDYALDKASSPGFIGSLFEPGSIVEVSSGTYGPGDVCVQGNLIEYDCAYNKIQELTIVPPTGYYCAYNKLFEVRCGDNVCSDGEDCSTCAEDCLGYSQMCCSDESVNGECCVDSDCPDENGNEYCEDNYMCGVNPYCGDGSCTSAAGEDCSTCAEDCGCFGAGRVCGDSGFCENAEVSVISGSSIYSYCEKEYVDTYSDLAYAYNCGNFYDEFSLKYYFLVGDEDSSNYDAEGDYFVNPNAFFCEMGLPELDSRQFFVGSQVNRVDLHTGDPENPVKDRCYGDYLIEAYCDESGWDYPTVKTITVQCPNGFTCAYDSEGKGACVEVEADPQECNNNILEGNEECDGVLFATGMDSCSVLGFATGSISCNDQCVVDVSGCSDCGDGVCSLADGETCETCSSDCGCSAGQTCSNEGCVDEVGCGDGTCASNENCYDCSEDCGCDATLGEMCMSFICTIPPPEPCGNGVLEGELGEQCDDWNVEDRDGCNEFCQIENYYDCTEDSNSLSTCVSNGGLCGDYVRQYPPEGCDDGDTFDNDGCNDNCQEESDWTCTEDSNGLSTCIADFVCGDSLIQGDEICDNGDINGVQCSPIYGEDCTWCGSDCLEEFIEVGGACGNGIIEAWEEGGEGEECDGSLSVGQTCSNLGFDVGTLVCNIDCTLGGCSNSVCGNDAVEGDEECDGISLNGEDCIAQGFESGDLTCLSDCSGFETSGCIGDVVEPAIDCGDSVIEGDEICDNGDINGVQCSPIYGEDCTWCSEDCLIEAIIDGGYCGDSIEDLNDGEECDDGNSVDDDGCTVCVIDANCDSIANCEGKVCGSDGCGGNCGICDGQVCNAYSGLCEDFSSQGFACASPIDGAPGIQVKTRIKHTDEETDEETLKYCSPVSLEFEDIKGLTVECNGDYECVSNICIDVDDDGTTECASIKAEFERREANLVQRIACAVSNLVGYFNRDDVDEFGVSTETIENNNYLACAAGVD
jgi:cysteine-rich repeat protein